MRLVLVGAVDSTKAALDAMIEAGYPPALLVTLTTDLAKRHSDFVDLEDAASGAGVPVYRTRKSDCPETQDKIRAVDPDIVLVVGWSQICGPDFLAIPKIGCLGFHPSALPELRGRAAIPWTILSGTDRAGASFFWIDEGTDTGDIAAQMIFPIDPETETARSLYDRQLEALKTLLVDLLAQLEQGTIPRRPQSHDKATWCARRRPEDGRIDWTRPVSEISRLIRAVGPPYPGAFSKMPDGSGTVTICNCRRDADGHRYLGLPGQIQSVTQDGFRVKCGDGACLIVENWSPSEWRPKLHQKLE